VIASYLGTDEGRDQALGCGAAFVKSAPDWGKYGRRPLRILALVALIDAIDRQILPGVLDKVQNDLGFSDFQAGLLGGAPVLAGFLVVLPAGYLADRYLRKFEVADNTSVAVRPHTHSIGESTPSVSFTRGGGTFMDADSVWTRPRMASGASDA
jgi:hypothetical protein